MGNNLRLFADHVQGGNEYFLHSRFQSFLNKIVIVKGAQDGGEEEFGR